MVFGMENTSAVGERRKGSGDGRWLLEGKNGKGGGGGEGLTEKGKHTATGQ
jgi:hypothetical protein